MAEVAMTLMQRSHLGTGPRAAFRQKTLTHVPGSVLRGALAAAWIAAHDGTIPKADRGEFIELFEHGVSYGPLFASRPPLPLSLRVHQYPATARCAQSAWNEAQLDAMPPRLCPQCESPITRVSPEVDPFVSLPRTVVPATVTQTHVSIDRDGVAADRGLFVRQSLEPVDQQPFVGYVEGSADALKVLTSLQDLRIGGRRSSGGRAKLQWRQVAYLAPRPLDSQTIVVRLISPGIFVDDRGAPSPVPNSRDLKAALGVPAVVQRRWTRWTEVGGWHIASGLPKHTEQAVAAGSTYVITTREPLLTEGVIGLGRGLGLRRNEGFGAVGDRHSDPDEWAT